MNALATFLLSAALANDVQGPVIEMGSTVAGNQEQPRVLYVVPWQAADGPDSLYQDFSTQIDSLLEPVARESFQRELDLRNRFHQLTSDSQGAQK